VEAVVKSPRRYRSPRRDAQAANTRAEIANAGHRLFVAQGYVRTTLADIADAAGVAVPTVKSIYGTKRAVLLAALERAIKGGDDPTPVADLEWYRAILEEPDPRRQLRLQADQSRGAKSRIAPLIEVIKGAATSDPEINELWTRMRGEFHDNQRRLIKALQHKGRLRQGLTEKRATDLLVAFNDVYYLLVVQQGWTVGQYERWLATTLIEQLLEPEE